MVRTPQDIPPSVIEDLRGFFQTHGRAPSFAELARLAGYASKNAAFRLVNKLMDAGVVEKDASGRIRLAGNLRPVIARPLLGYVQAGFPSPAEEELLDQVSLDDFLIRKPQASFLLKVSGDSMINAGIQPGDMVVVERGTTPKNGDIVLAQVDREWTLKYFERRGGRVLLVPANPRYPEIIAHEELKVEGVVRASMRRY
jgi:repressor LexA